MEVNETSGIIIFLAVISTTLLWTTLYFLSNLVYPTKRPIWHCFLVCLMDSIISTILTYMIQMRKDPRPYTHPGEKSTDTHVLAIAVCLGFYLFESGWYLAHPGSKSLAWKIHHIVSILIFVEPLCAGVAGAEICHMIFCGQITLQPMMIGWFLLESGYPQLYILVFEYMFVIMFFYFRIIVATPVTLYLIQSSTSRITFKVLVLFMYFIGLVFLKQKTLATIRHTNQFLKDQLQNKKDQ